LIDNGVNGIREISFVTERLGSGELVTLSLLWDGLIGTACNQLMMQSISWLSVLDIVEEQSYRV